MSHYKLETFYATTTMGSLAPNRYLEIKAPSNTDARIIAKCELKRSWAFIYSEKDFGDQKDRLKPLYRGAITVTKDEMPFYKKKMQWVEEVEQFAAKRKRELEI